jgi:hypothetical protein
MAFTPPPHPNTRPRQAVVEGGGAEPRAVADRAFLADWLAHVAAGNMEQNPAMSDEIRAAILANERVICGRQRTARD